MCYNCGCGVPNDNMGYGDVSDGGGGLVEEDFVKMADITKMSIEQTKKEVFKTLGKQLKKVK